MPLANLPKTFGLDLSMYSKGDFPHIFNCLENQNYIGPFATFRIFFSGNSFKVGLPNICMVVQENLIQKVPLSCQNLLLTRQIPGADPDSSNGLNLNPNLQKKCFYMRFPSLKMDVFFFSVSIKFFEPTKNVMFSFSVHLLPSAHDDQVT